MGKAKTTGTSRSLLSARAAITMLAMDFQGERICDDCGSKSTRGSNSLPSLHLPKRASQYGEGFEHRERWIEERLQTFAESFAASGCGFAVMNKHLHSPVRLESVCTNGWSVEDIVQRWLVTNASRN